MMSSSLGTTFYLEMRDFASFRSSVCPAGFDISLVKASDHHLNRKFYAAIGAEWNWTDRAGWSEDEWRAYADSNLIKTFIGQVNGDDVGYFELASQEGGEIEIVYFGLLPEWIGRGFGGALLSSAVEQAWQLTGTRRVWLHTCTHDHEHALKNYLARGFEVFKTEPGE